LVRSLASPAAAAEPNRWAAKENNLMSKDELDNRKAKHDYLANWLENYGQAEELVPKVQREKEKTEWEIEALDNAPDEADEIPKGDMVVNFEIDYEHLTHTLPMLPTFDTNAFMGSTGVSTSGTASVYEFVSRVGDIGTQKAIEYSNHFTGRYQAIQSEHNRSTDIRILLARFHNQGTSDRFERAEDSYMRFKAGVGERTAAAMEIRTFLDGLKGDLFQKAKKREKENMTWEEMAIILSKGGASSVECHEMVQQGKIRSSLISRLSDVGKNREGGSITDLNHIWTEALDHIYTVLNIINL
jgi:hypothetical protein